MHALRLAGAIAGFTATACQSYSAAPVDLGEHARQFADRVPDGESIRAFAARLQQVDPTLPGFDPGDGLDRREGSYVALWCNAELRAMRLRAGIAEAAAAHAGRWADPELSGDVVRILENVDHPWLAGGALAFTLPITGRPGLEQDLADSRHAQALQEARLAEAHVLDLLDAAWVRWSAARLAAGQLQDLVQRLTALAAIADTLAAAQELTQVEARAFTLDRLSREAQQVRAEAAVAAAAIDIAQLLGLPPDRPLELVPSMAIEPRVADAAARRAQLEGSRKVTLLQREHDVAERHLALAIRKQWPELTLLPGFQEEDAQPRAALGFSLPLPLWNGNAREIAEARAARDVAAAALRGGLERAVQDLARAEVRQQAALRQRRLVDDELVPFAEQQVADGRRMAELGQLNTLLILDGLTRSYEAKALAIDAALAEAEATIEINSLFWPTLHGGDVVEAGR